MNMTRLLVSLFGSACLLLAADYKAETGSAPPSEVPPAYQQLLTPEGVRVVGPNGPLAEFWFVRQLPAGATTSEPNVSFSTTPHGALIGVVRFTIAHSDRRGQKIAAGIYTLRHSLYPQDGAHQGISPQRDFLILTRIADDPGPASTPSFAELMSLSAKASGTSHPLSLSYWKEEANYFKGGVVEEEEGVRVLQVKVGDVPVSLIVTGTYTG